MTNNWQLIFDRIDNVNLTSPSWKSDHATLLDLLSKAKNLGADPAPLQNVSYSNLRTIIRPLKAAVQERDADKINFLFLQSSKMSNSDLRLAMNVSDPETICVKQVNSQTGIEFQISLSPKQFERIKLSTKLFFKYEIT